MLNHTKPNPTQQRHLGLTASFGVNSGCHFLVCGHIIGFQPNVPESREKSIIVMLRQHRDKRQSNCTQAGFPPRRYCKQTFLIGSIKEAFEGILLRLDCFLNCNVLLHHLIHPCDIETVVFSFVEEGSGILSQAVETL